MKALLKIFNLMSFNEKKITCVLIILLIIGMFFEVLSIGMILPVLSFFLDSQNTIGYLNKYDFIANLNISETNYGKVILFSIAVIFSIKILFLIFLTWWQAKLAYKVNLRLSKELYEKYLHQP